MVDLRTVCKAMRTAGITVGYEAGRIEGLHGGRPFDWDGLEEEPILAFILRDAVAYAVTYRPGMPPIVPVEHRGPRMKALHWLNSAVMNFSTSGAAETLAMLYNAGMVEGKASSGLLNKTQEAAE